MLMFSYRARGGSNQGQAFKGTLDKVAWLIDFTDGCPSGVTVSSAASTALDSSNGSATTQCCGTTTVSSNVVTFSSQTCGTSGTQAAIDGARFDITHTATLSNGEPLVFNVYVLIEGPTYNPD